AWAEKSSSGRVPPATAWTRMCAEAVPLLVRVWVGVIAFVPDSSQIVPPAVTRECAAVNVLNGAACVPAFESEPFGPTQNSLPVPPVPIVPAAPAAPVVPAVPVVPPRPVVPAMPVVPALPVVPPRPAAPVV